MGTILSETLRVFGTPLRHNALRDEEIVDLSRLLRRSVLSIGLSTILRMRNARDLVQNLKNLTIHLIYETNYCSRWNRSGELSQTVFHLTHESSDDVSFIVQNDFAILRILYQISKSLPLFFVCSRSQIVLQHVGQRTMYLCWS